MLKNPPEFLKKIHKNQFSASWRGLMVFIHIYKVVYLLFQNTFVIIHHNARTTLKATFKTFAKNICKNISKVAFRVVLAL